MTGDDDGRPRPARRGSDTRLVLLGAIGVLLAWFALANLGDVRIEFWVTSTRAPLVVVVAIAAVLGGAVGALAQRHRPAAGTGRRRRRLARQSAGGDRPGLGAGDPLGDLPGIDGR